MNNKVNITHVSNLHSDWIRSIDFYKHELSILKARLTEVAGKNTAGDMLQETEHFENQFAIQANNLDNLGHDIRANAGEIARQAEKTHYIDGMLLSRHNDLEEAFHHEGSTINSLRRDFNRFAAKWM